MRPQEMGHPLLSVAAPSLTTGGSKPQMGEGSEKGESTFPHQSLSFEAFSKP